MKALLLTLMIALSINAQTFRNAVLLHHSTGGRIFDYDTYLQVEQCSTSVPNETHLRNIAEGFTGADSLKFSERWLPTFNGTGNEWADWHDIIDGRHEDTGWFAALPDTFSVITIKSCGPAGSMVGWGSAEDTVNSATYNLKTVYNYKWHLRSVVKWMENHPNTFFVIWTQEPQGDWETTIEASNYCHQFSTWLKDTLATGLDVTYGVFPPNIYVFDFFHYMGDPNNTPAWTNKHSFAIDYPNDNHPSPACADFIAPLYVTETWDAALAFEASLETPIDSLPNSFSFIDITGATRNTLYTSNAVTLAGFDSAYAYANGYEFTVYNIGDIPPYIYGTGYVKVFPNDIIRVRQMSSGSYSTPTNVTLTVGSGSDTYKVTTETAPTSTAGSKFIKLINGKLIRDANGKIINTQLTYVMGQYQAEYVGDSSKIAVTFQIKTNAGIVKLGSSTIPLQFDSLLLSIGHPADTTYQIYTDTFYAFNETDSTYSDTVVTDTTMILTTMENGTDYVFHNFSGGNYATATVTHPLTNVVWLNIILPQGEAGASVGSNSWTSIATLTFNVIGAVDPADLTFTWLTSSPYWEIFDSNNLTLLNTHGF